MFSCRYQPFGRFLPLFAILLFLALKMKGFGRAGTNAGRLVSPCQPLHAEVALKRAFAVCTHGHHAKRTGLHAHAAADALRVVDYYRLSGRQAADRTRWTGVYAGRLLAVLAVYRYWSVIEILYVDSITRLFSGKNHTLDIFFLRVLNSAGKLASMAPKASAQCCSDVHGHGYYSSGAKGCSYIMGLSLSAFLLLSMCLNIL